MLAVDTNLIVRYLTRDQPEQAAQAKRAIEGETIYVPKTVLLESEWFLRAVYGFSRDEIMRAFALLAGLPQVNLEAEAQVRRAVDWANQGMDFADALHLAAAEGCDAFLSQDRDLARIARKLGAPKVQRP